MYSTHINGIIIMDSYRSNERQTTNSFVTQTKAINLTVYRVVVAPVGFVVTVHTQSQHFGMVSCTSELILKVDHGSQHVWLIHLCQYDYEKFHNREMR